MDWKNITTSAKKQQLWFTVLLPFLALGVVIAAENLRKAERRVGVNRPALPTRKNSSAQDAQDRTVTSRRDTGTREEAIVSGKQEKDLGQEKPASDPAQAMEYYRLKRLPQGAKEIPVEKYQTARDQMREMRQYSSAQNQFGRSGYGGESATSEAVGTWTSLGPGNIGGRTRALIIHPTNPQIMFAGGVAGGVWKTTNGGAMWQPLTDLMSNLAVTCLTFDPTNPNIIYAGTGEGFFNYNAIRGAGIFKSLDGGNTWQQIISTSTDDFYYVNKVVISPNNTQRIYAATWTGVWKSLNGGATWTHSLNGYDIPGGCLDLVIRTDKTTDYLFASCGTFYQAGIYRNTDGATTNTWVTVVSEPNMGRTTIALAPSNQNVIYAAASSIEETAYKHGLYAVFKSGSSGDAGTWTKQVQNTDQNKLNTLLFSNSLAATVRDCGFVGHPEIDSQGWYNNAIAVDPKDENRVWVGGTDLFRSDDGGKNWGLASYWWAGNGSAGYAHSNEHLIVFPPNYNGMSNKQMFVGNDGGIFRTDDARAEVATGVLAPCNPVNTKVVWKSLNNNYAVTQFYHGVIYPDGKTWLGGTQGNGTIRGSDAKGVGGWEGLTDGDGGFVALDPTNTDILFVSNPGGRFRKSTDAGATFSRSLFGLNDDQRLFITPLVIDPSNPQHLWTGGSHLWRTDKGAANWTQASNQSGMKITAIAVAPSDSNYVLAAGLNSGIMQTNAALTADDDTVWQTALPRAGFVSGLTFDPTNPQIAYATYSTFGGAHVWKSMNSGLTWASIDGAGNGALPDIPVNCIVVDPTNSARLFIGTDMGVFVSVDGGNSWNVENTGFANVPVESLALNTVSGVTTLYAFTHGRGVWRIALGSGCKTSLSKASQTFSQVGGTGSFGVTGNCTWAVTVNQSGAGWVTITSTSNGAVNYSVAANTQPRPRAGTITIGGTSFSVVQPNAAGSFSTADSTPPIIKIITPDPAQVLKPASKFITLRGTATDDRSVEEIYYINDSNGQKVSIGKPATSPNWELSIQINGGINHLTVVARDAAGNIGTAKISVLYNVPRTIISLAGTGNALDVGGFSGDGGAATIAQIRNPRGLVVDAAGNVIFVDGGNHRVRKITPQGIISTIAGDGTQGFGGDNGQAVNANLNSPFGLALDSAGNLYIADEGNHRIRKVTPQGIISTVAGNGSFSSNVVGDGGAATQAELNQPKAIAVDTNGNLYIGDAQLGRIRKVTASTGIITTIAGAGSSGSTAEGAAALAANLGSIMDLVLDTAGNIYFSQGFTAASRIKKIAANGSVSTFGNVVSATGLALDKNGNLYATSFIGGMVYKHSADGTSTVVAGNGNSISNINDFGDGGPPTDAVLRQPIDVAIDAGGSLYISDSLNRIRKVLDTPIGETVLPTIALSLPTTATAYTTTSPTLRLTGSSSDNVMVTHVTWSNNRGGNGVCVGTGAWATTPLNPNLITPARDILLQTGINIITLTAWDLSGNASSFTLTVNFNPSRYVSTVAGNLTNGYTGENTSGLLAQLWSPENVALDGAGNVYIADRGNHVIRKVNADGIITTFAGTGQLGSSGDGGPAINASFNEPTSVAFDAQGNLFVADSQNNRIRKISPSGIITTAVGTGAQDFSGDGGQAATASLNLPRGITVDKNGNLYIADADNNRIRKVTALGVISSIAGVNIDGFTGDGGPATDAQIFFPTSVAVDNAGNIFFSDTGNHRIRKITPDGIINTVWGTGSAGFSGDDGLGINAQLNAPGGLSIDTAGNLYVADRLNHRIRKMGLDGKVSTVVGSGVQGVNGDGTDVRTTQLDSPAGVGLDQQGNFYIADTENHRVIKIKSYNSVTSVSAASYFPGLPVAPESVISAFGPNLASSLIINTQLPLPMQLGTTRVKVKDSAGIERLAPLYFISMYQVNYQVPKGTALGVATVTVMNGDTPVATEVLQIVSTQAGLFSGNSDGQGAAAASLIFVKNGIQSFDLNYTCGAGGCVPKPIDLSVVDAAYIEMFGTGVRFRNDLANAKATIGGIEGPVLYAGAHCCYVGVDQINLQIPKSLMGRGEVDVVLTIEGKIANTVKINVK